MANLALQKYNEYIHEVSLTADNRYTFPTLSTHADQILALYERELLMLEEFRTNNINTRENLRLLGIAMTIKGRTCADVNNMIVNREYDSAKTNAQLNHIIELANMLRARELCVEMNIREIKVILTRIQHLVVRNTPQ